MQQRLIYLRFLTGFANAIEKIDQHGIVIYATSAKRTFYLHANES